MKRQIAVWLFCTMLLTSVTGCGAETGEETVTSQTEAVQETETVAVETEPVLPGPEVVDVQGAELRFYNYPWKEAGSYAGVTFPISVDESNGEILNDTLYEREIKVEELYNAKILELEHGGDEWDNHAYIGKAAKAGDSPFDLLQLFDANVASDTVGGYLLNWAELDIDMSQPWWDVSQTEQYNFFGVQPAATGAYALCNYATRYCYVFNKDMLKDVRGDVNLYDWVREGKWTLDAMYSIAEDFIIDKNGDGELQVNRDQYFVGSQVNQHFSALFAGAGCKYIDKNEAGELYFSLAENEYAQSVVQKIIELNTPEGMHISGHENDDGNGPIGGYDTSIFLENHAFLTATSVGGVTGMREMDADIGILPCPKFDENQESYHTLVEGGAHTVISVALAPERYESTAILIDALGYYSYLEALPAYTEVVLSDKTVRDTESADMLDIIFETSFYDLGTGAWSAATKNKLTLSLFCKKSTDIASFCSKNKKSVDSELTKFTKAILKQLEE